MADGSALNVLGKGDVYIKTNLGLWILKVVRYILGFSRQLEIFTKRCFSQFELTTTKGLGD